MTAAGFDAAAESARKPRRRRRKPVDTAAPAATKPAAAVPHEKPSVLRRLGSRIKSLFTPSNPTR